MTIYYRLKVWAIKGWRAAKNAFKFVHKRTVNAIWLTPVFGTCDYCGNNMSCATLECDYEVIAKICAGCLDKAKAVIVKREDPKQQDARRGSRGVVVQ